MSNPVALSVNVNKIALLRNSRGGELPSVVAAARTAIEAGARGITVHPRPDQRHIRPDDVYQLSTLLRTEYPHIEFNIEGNPFAGARENGYPGFMELVEATRPEQVTLVPDDDNQLTSDHGWHVNAFHNELTVVLERCHACGSRVSLFMDPDPTEIDAAANLGTDRIELYTGPWAVAYAAGGSARSDSLTLFRQAADHAAERGLGVNAGHDLDLENLGEFASITSLAEVSIGHALTTDALRMGYGPAVRAYVEILEHAAANPAAG